MKKYIHSLLLLILPGLLTLLPVTATAQWNIGVQGGYTLNTLEVSNGYAYDLITKPAGGFTVSIPVQYEFNEWFALQTELGFTQKNYKRKRTLNLSQDEKSLTTNSYVQLPILAHFSFGGKVVRGFTNLGIYGGYWANSHIKGTDKYVFAEPDIDYNYVPVYSYDERVPFDSRRDNRFDLGLIAGVGVKVRVCPIVQLLAEGRFNYSLLDMQKNYMRELMPRYNNTLQFQIGCLITIK